MFTDRMLEIDREACRVQLDKRLSDEGRGRKVCALEDELLDRCWPMWVTELPPLEGLANDDRKLINEVVRLLLGDQLFTFVTAKPTEQPNGTTRPVDRTNKTLKGARRQMILTSVLESLRLYLPTFTLSTVLVELKRWWETGRSCFAELVQKLRYTPPEKSALDQLLPGPSG